MHIIRTQIPKDKAGFTLIEMIVSLGIFAVVMTIAVGSLLVLIYNNQKLQGEQSVMTNLAFALDGMTREIRTGTNYFCEDRNNYSAGGPSNIFNDSNNQDVILGNSVDDCPTPPGGGTKLRGISFIEGGDSITGASAERILYFYDQASSSIKRRVGSNPPQSILSSGLEVIDAQFIVTGAEVANEQPTVTIFIEAKETNDDKIYRLQTTVTQRTLDL